MGEVVEGMEEILAERAIWAATGKLYSILRRRTDSEDARHHLVGHLREMATSIWDRQLSADGTTEPTS